MFLLLATNGNSLDQRLADVMPFAIALALGALIGLERERSARREPRRRFARNWPGRSAGRAAGGSPSLPGGIRTFPLIGVLGCSAAWLGERLGVEVLVAVLAAFALLTVAVYAITSLAGDVGMTTEVAALLTFVFGAMVYHEHALLASALAVTTTVLLSLREPLHAWAGKIETEDLYAALKLAVVSVIVLPLLPDQSYGPEGYRIYNPFRIWLLVVFIAALGFLGYVGIKLFGPHRGILAGGGLGGLVSSTAATLSFAGRSKEQPELSPMFALAIVIAWMTMFARVLIEVAVVNADLLPLLIIPVAAALVVGAAGGAYWFLRARRAGPPPEVKYRNPFSLTSALKFGLLFLAVLTVARAAQVWFADAGLMLAAALSGLVDVDAMTLSVARLSRTGELAPETANRAICVVLASNTLVKAGLAAALGAPALRRTLWPLGAAMLLAGGIALLVF